MQTGDRVGDQSDVWVIVPVYNEAPVVAAVVENARTVFPNIVCVDDGSKDGSDAEILSTGAHLVKHPVNLGAGAAIQSGVEYARAQPGARYFVTFDADGQHQVKDALRMVERLRHEDVDLLIGTRFHGDISHIPFSKRLVLKTAVKLSPRGRRLQMTDSHNGLRAFDRKVADEMDINVNGMGHAPEIISMIEHFGWKAGEEPVDIIYSEYSIGKGQSLLNGVNIIFDSAVRRRK